MATGTVYRFAKKKENNTIEGEKLVVDTDGSLTRVNEIIFTSESPAIPQGFTDEINALIQSGDIVIPQQDSLSMHVVDITDQLQAGKYTYNIVDANGSPLSCGAIFRVFFNGLNVSEDIDISEDRKSFTFFEAYSEEVFGYSESRLVIDFIEG